MRTRIQFLLPGLLILLGAFPAGRPAAAAPSEVEQVRQTIETLYRARTRIFGRQTGAPTSEQAGRDFTIFIAYLDGRIAASCEILRDLAGTRALSGLPCPAGKAAAEAGRLESLPRPAGPTSRERTEHLEAELQAGLSRFDDMLLEEQERIAAAYPRQREGGLPGASGDGRGAGASGSDGTSAHSRTDGSPAEAAPAGRFPSDTGAGSGTAAAKQTKLPPTAGSRPLPEDGDDIVAAQLREAAEQETDPEIKAKLWEEYRRYKAGIN